MTEPPLSPPPRFSDAPPVWGREPGSPRPWGFWLTVAFGLCIFGAFVMAQTAVVIVAAAIHGSISDPAAVEALAANGLVLSIAILMGLPLDVGLCVLFAWMRRRLSVADYLGLKAASCRSILLGLFSVVVLGVAYDWISTALHRPEMPEFMIHAYQTVGFVPLLWVAIVIGAPLSEEIFFRGFLFKGFEASPVGGVGAILLTSLSWAAIHLQYGLYDMVAIFSLGLLLGMFRLTTGSILPTFLMHVLQNVVATVQVAGAVSDQALPPSLL